MQKAIHSCAKGAALVVSAVLLAVLFWLYFGEADFFFNSASFITLSNHLLVPCLILAVGVTMEAAFGPWRNPYLLPGGLSVLLFIHHVYYLTVWFATLGGELTGQEVLMGLTSASLQLALRLGIGCGGLALFRKWRRGKEKSPTQTVRDKRICAFAALLLGVGMIAAGFGNEWADANLNSKYFGVLDAYGDTYPMPQEEIEALDALSEGVRLNRVSGVEILYRGGPEKRAAYQFEKELPQNEIVEIYGTDRPAWELKLSLARDSGALWRVFGSAAIVLIALGVILLGSSYLPRLRKAARILPT